METIYDLELHEEIAIGEFAFCMRVPGGWIYTTLTQPGSVASVFVPFNNEFME